jgi:drug/metabolite transporter (DMT)-like permease
VVVPPCPPPDVPGTVCSGRRTSLDNQIGPNNQIGSNNQIGCLVTDLPPPAASATVPPEPVPTGAQRPSAPRLPVGGVLLLLALTVVWGLNWPVNKIALAEIPVCTFRAVVAVAAAASVLAIARLSGHSLYVPAKERIPLAVVSLFNISGWMYFSAVALTLIPAGHTAVIGNTMPLWACLIAIPLLGERPHPVHWLGLALGISGVLLLAIEDFSSSDGIPRGTGAVLAGAVCFAIGTVLPKRVTWTMPVLTRAGWQFLIGGIPLAIAAITDLDTIGPVSPVSVGAVLYTVLVGMAFGYWAWLRLVAMVPAGIASLATLAIPAVSLIAGALLLAEPIGWVEIFALLLVGGALTTVLPRPRLPAVIRSGGPGRGSLRRG